MLLVRQSRDQDVNHPHARRGTAAHDQPDSLDAQFEEQRVSAYPSADCISSGGGVMRTLVPSGMIVSS